MYLNKALIFGNLTRDPELKALPSGTNVANFGIATNRRYKDQEGTLQEATEFHNIVVFGRQAETTAQYLSKGSSALIEGRLQTRSWEGQDGQKKYRTEIVADRVQFGPRTGNQQPATDNKPASAQGSGEARQQATDNKEADQIEYPEEVNPDDIPF